MARTSWLGKKSAKEEASPSTEEPSETERERQLHGLAVLSLFLHTTAAVEEIAAMLLEQAPTVTSAVFVYPLLLDRKRQLLRPSLLEGCADPRLEAAMDAFQEDITAIEFSLVQKDELYRILDEGEVALRDSFGVLMEGVLPDEQWKSAEKTLKVKKLALVPMVVENEPLGLVVFGFDRDEIDVEALELLVGHLTLALRDLLVRDEAVRFSDVDPITWVHNRRHLMQALKGEMVRAGRYGRALSLALLDIDGFGQFNADYGQSTGDRLLRLVGTTLGESVSAPELVARIKDDDFAVLLPETNRAAAVTTITRLLASLTQVSAFNGDDQDPQSVTMSVAIACFPEDGGTPEALLNRVVSDLKAAKQEKPVARPVDPVARAAGQSGE